VSKNINTKTGKNIARIRKKKNMTQRQLAEKIGVSQQQIGQWENAIKNPKIETILKISKALSCNPKEIIAEFDEEYDCLYSVSDIFSEIKERLENQKVLEKEAKESGQYQKASEAHGAYSELSAILEYFGEI